MAKVLIVDDDEDIRETYADALGAAGHHVDVVSSGTKAINVMTKIKPDYVILDMHMPGESGSVVLAFVRKMRTLAATKVFIISGYPERAKMAASDWGADGWLAKPVSFEQLRALIPSTNAQAS
jgi:DNA-binding response OmpR family regulator